MSEINKNAANIRKKTIYLLVTLLLVFPAITFWVDWRTRAPRKPAPIPLGDYSYSVEYAEYRIAQLMERKHLPSVAVVLIDDQDTIWQETFGTANLKEDMPVESNTVYKLWSVAKVFTAIETMRLVEEGLVDLDASITEYIPNFSIQSRFADSEPVTIRRILTHRSGLPRNGCYWIDFRPDALVDLAASLEDCHLAYPVGYRYKYSNIGFDTLGFVIEEMRDALFPDFMREKLLIPIGMNDSAFMRSQIPYQRDLALGYEYYNSEYYPYEQSDIKNFPSGNLYSTIEDMGTFVKFIFREGNNANGEQIISPETLESMFMVQATSARDPQPMGLGWKIAQVFGSERLVWHDGGPSEGIGALVAMLPERKLGVALFANGTTFDGSVSVALALDILELMLETKYGVITPPEETQAIAEIERTILEDYVGKYVAFGEVMEVFLRGDQFKGNTQGFTFNLDPLSENTFQPGHWLVDIGLANLLGVPIDLRQLKVEFMVGDETDDDVMIINIGGISYEICPRYPDIEEIPLLWEELIGEYDLVARLPSGAIDKKVLGNATIWMENDMLQMGGVVGPILPISETEIIILSGPFAGETMAVDPETGNIQHQQIVYIQQ
jgi:CubicO group peptidase (beta-lactamase class C family)